MAAGKVQRGTLIAVLHIGGNAFGLLSGSGVADGPSASRGADVYWGRGAPSFEPWPDGAVARVQPTGVGDAFRDVAFMLGCVVAPLHGR